MAKQEAETTEAETKLGHIQRRYQRQSAGGRQHHQRIGIPVHLPGISGPDRTDDNTGCPPDRQIRAVRLQERGSETRTENWFSSRRHSVVAAEGMIE